MKAIWKYILVIFCFFVTNNIVYAGSNLVKVSEHVYSYVDIKEASPTNSFGANAGIILGQDFIIVIDTLISSKEAKRFISDIRKVSDLPINYVINTHFHLDHIFGNSEFSKLGASIISHQNCKTNMMEFAEYTLKNIGTYGLTEKDMEGTEIDLPDITFRDKMQIDLGNIKVDILSVGHSHTQGSIIVSIPEEKLLFAGDILFTNYHP